MKNLLIGVITLLASACSTLPSNGNTDARTAYFQATSATLDQAGKLDGGGDELGVRAGIIYRLSDAESSGCSTNHFQGLASDLSVDYAHGDSNSGGIDLGTDRIGLNLGLRYYLGEVFSVQPYLGGGVATQYLRAQTSLGEDVDDFAIGGYGTAGVEVPLGTSLRAGLSYRRTFGAEFNLGDSDSLDFDTDELALTIGLSF